MRDWGLPDELWFALWGGPLDRPLEFLHFFSSGGGLNQGLIGDLESEGSEQLRLWRHFLAQ